jgi:hypothetical protein
VAVEEELKATRVMVLQDLFAQNFSKHFIKTSKATIFYGLRQPEKPRAEDKAAESDDNVRQVEKPQIESAGKVPMLSKF